jgi:hypothetical protein
VPSLRERSRDVVPTLRNTELVHAAEQNLHGSSLRFAQSSRFTRTFRCG